MSKRAVLLAGGKGTRLHPYTIVFPKPLVPIGDIPILEIIVRQLTSYQFTHLTIAVNHQAELIQAFFGNGEKWGIKIDYSLEDHPLSTMGPLKLISDLPEDFLVMNGDVLTDLHFGEFYEFHVNNKHHFTTSSTQRKDQSEYGVLSIDSLNRLTGFQEKPTYTYDVSMGIYMLNHKILEYIPANQPYGYDDLMEGLLQSKNYPHVKKFDGYWLDIGREADYSRAINEFDSLKSKLLK